jgi:hypothetical protein
VKCSEFLKELTDYLDNTMDPGTRSELEEHLQWCHNCYVVCNTTKSTIEIYRGSQLYELPDDLRLRIRSAIITKCNGMTIPQEGSTCTQPAKPDKQSC